MHPNFGDWYRDVSVNVDGDSLAARWNGVDHHQANLEVDSVPHLVRIAYRSAVSEDVLDGFRQPFHEEDSAFPMRDNDEELAILAGAILIAHLDAKANDSGNFAALLIRIRRLAGATSAVHDLSGSAESYLTQKGLQARRVVHKGVPASADPDEAKQSLLNLASKAANAANPPQMQEEIKEAAESIGAVLRGLRTGIQRALAYADQLQRIDQEQSDVLWWLFGQASRVATGDLTAIKESAKALVIGSELAELVQVIPPPTSYEAFIDRALLEAGAKPDTTTTVEEAVESIVDMESGTSQHPFSEPKQLEDLLPVHTSIHLATQIGEGWRTGIERKAGLEPNAEFTTSRLSQLTFNEALAARFETSDS